jgi:hypothetical protein
MEVLRCRSPQIIQKELRVYLLAYNLIRLVMGAGRRAALDLAARAVVQAHCSTVERVQFARRDARGQRNCSAQHAVSADRAPARRSSSMPQ